MRISTCARRALAALATATALAGTSGAVAAVPTYAGTFGSVGGTLTGSVQAESGPFTDGAHWSFYTFSAALFDPVSIRITPGAAAFDPVIAVWYGQESDTANYFDMFSDSLNTSFVAAADGVGPFALGGPGTPAALDFNNIYGSGLFVLAVADYRDGLGSGALGYSLAVAMPVPEPQVYVQFALGLGALGFVLARRKRG